MNMIINMGINTMPLDKMPINMYKRLSLSLSLLLARFR